MAKRTNSIYCLRKDGRYPNGHVFQPETNTGRVGIAIFPNGPEGFSFELDRRTARLLARRINQFLDATK